MTADPASYEPFKTCPLCGERWWSLADFVQDRRLRVGGYSAFFDDPGQGLIFVTHQLPGCRTTMALPARDLEELYHGPAHTDLHRGADDCARLCLDRHRVEECDAPCAMAWVRVVLQNLRKHEMPGDEAPADTPAE